MEVNVSELFLKSNLFQMIEMSLSRMLITTYSVLIVWFKVQIWQEWVTWEKLKHMLKVGIEKWEPRPRLLNKRNKERIFAHNLMDCMKELVNKIKSKDYKWVNQMMKRNHKLNQKVKDSSQTWKTNLEDFQNNLKKKRCKWVKRGHQPKKQWWMMNYQWIFIRHQKWMLAIWRVRNEQIELINTNLN